MKKKTSFWIQAIGVLTLVLGNFFTAGTALADVVSTKEVSADNAKLIDGKRALVTRSKVGEQANLAFDFTVGGLSQAGTVKFDYNADYFKIKDKKFKFSNGDTKVVVDIDGKDSTISWMNAIDKTDLEVVLPVKFNRTVNDRELDFVVDDEKVKLPTLTVLDEDEKVKQEEKTDQLDGNLQDDDILRQALADEKASDEAQTARDAEEAKQDEAKKETEVKTEEKAEPKKENEIDENSSQADDVQQPKQSNSEKAEALLKEKREADQKKAEEKSRQAIEESKKSDRSSKAAKADVDNQKIETSTEIRKSSTPSGSPITEMQQTQEAVSGDDRSDGEQPSQDLNNQLGLVNPLNTPKNLNDYVDTNFFSSITLAYDGGDINIPTQIDQSTDVSVPIEIADSESITLDWRWDTTSIERGQSGDNFIIEDGDYYDFTLKGFELDYDGKSSIDGNLVEPNSHEVIGKYSITNTGKGTHNVRITFLPGARATTHTLLYGMKLTSTFSEGSTEVSFGEIAKDKATIPVKEAGISLQKEAAWDTGENGAMVDYNSILWTSTFNVEGTAGADKVVMLDKTGGDYEYQENVSLPAVYTFVVYDGTVDDDGNPNTITISKGDKDFTRIISNAGWRNRKFTFNAEDLLGKDKQIHKIEVLMKTPVTNDQTRTFRNTIQVEEAQFGTHTTKTKDVIATLSREAADLMKKSSILDSGRIQYTVNFAVEEGQVDLTLIDELMTKMFTYQKFDQAGHGYKLVKGSDKTNLWDDLVDKSNSKITETDTGQEMQIQFKDELAKDPGNYTLTYVIEPTDDTKNEHYQGLKNKVTWGGRQTHSHVNNSTVNSKGHLEKSDNWQNFTSDWYINVNQVDRIIDGDITITEPRSTHREQTDLDFAKYYEILKNTGDKLSDYLEFHKTNSSGSTYSFMQYEGNYYWVVNDQREEKKAFSIQPVMDDGKVVGMQIVVHRMPGQTATNRVSQRFAVKLKGVPMDREKIAKNTSGYVYNYGTVTYDGEDDHVNGRTALPKKVQANISKEGQLSKGFHNSASDRKINWEVAFNYRSWLAGKDDELATILTEEGINFTDIIGTDKAWKDNENQAETSLFQSLDHMLDQNNLKVSLGRLSTDGSRVEDSEELKAGDYIVSGDKIDNSSGNKQQAKFNLKLTQSGLDVYNAGKTIFVLNFSSDVESLSTDPDKDFEHLKAWEFYNQMDVTGLPDGIAKDNKLTAKASVSYADSGHLLDKSGVLEENAVEINGKMEKVIKWSLLVNGEAKPTDNMPLKATDTIIGSSHTHLDVEDESLQVKVYKAVRSTNDKGEVEYRRGSVIDPKRYKITYSENLQRMEIEFDNGIGDKQPLMIDYHTIAASSGGDSDYQNEVILEIGGETFKEGELIESEVSGWAKFNEFGVNIVKTDAQNGQPLEGVKFGLQLRLKPSDEWADVLSPLDRQPITVTTNANGIATFYGLGDKPEYRVVELDGNVGYYERYESNPFTIEDVEDGQSIHVLHVTNAKSRDLLLKKTVESSNPELRDKTFKFQVEVTDRDGKVDPTFAGTFNITDNTGRDGKVTFVGGIATDIKLKDKESLKILGLPSDKHYRIIELDAAEYQTSHTTDNLNVQNESSNDKETGVLGFESNNSSRGMVHFTNKIGDSKFQFSKEIVGPDKKTDKDRTFDFKLRAYKDGQFDDSFTMGVPGIKHEGGEDKQVTLVFKDGISTHYTYQLDDQVMPITLKDGEHYRDITLPEGMKLKVSEAIDAKYGEGSYILNGASSTDLEEDDNDKGFYSVGPVVNGSNIKFTNKHTTNQFEFEKFVAGDMPAGIDSFNFKVAANDGATRNAVKNETYTADLRNASSDKTKNTGKVTFDENGQVTEIKYGTLPTEKITLKDNEKLVILGLPNKATKFKVTETTTGKFETYTRVDGESKNEGNNAEITLNRPDGVNSITFENIAPDLVEFGIKKTVIGLIPPTDEDLDFEFKLTVKNPPASWGEESDEFAYIKSDSNDEEPLKFVKDPKTGEFNYELTLKAGQSIRMFIPKGLKIQVTETKAHDYKVSHEFGKHQEDGDTHDVTTEKDMPQLVFNNDSQKTGIEVKKTVKGENVGDEDFNKDFTFEVKGTDENGGKLDGKFTLRKYEVSGKYTDTEKSFNANNIIAFNLKHDQKAQLLGLPIGAKIQVTETKASSEGYDPSYKVNENTEKSGNVATEFVTPEGKLGMVLFTNTKPTPESTNLKIKKVLAGPVNDKDEALDFEFRVTATPKAGVADQLNGTFKAEKLDHNGDTTDVNVTFKNGQAAIVGEEDQTTPITLKGGESINILGLPTDYKYTVSEKTRYQRFMFETSYNVNETSDKVGNETGEFALKDGQQGIVVFTNTKFEAETAELKISKHLAGGGIINADKNKTFKFVIEANTSVDGEYDALVNGHDKVKVTFTDGKATVNLKADENILIYGLPSEHNTYTVTETNGSGFHTQYQLNGTRMEDGVKTKEFKLVEKDRVNVDFTNSKDTPKLASLKINKEIAGDGLSDADHDRAFDFRMYSGVTGEFTAVKMDQHGDSHDMTVKFADGQSDVISLKDGESLTVNGLPIDYTYAVGEEFVEGFAPTYKVNDAKVQEGMTTQTFKLTEDQKGIVEFTNTKNGEMELGILSVSKFVNELGDQTRKFEFHIEATDGSNNPLNGTFKTQTTTSGQTSDGTIQLNGGNGTFTLTHGQTIKFFLPLGAKYEVAEQDYSKDGYVTTVTKRGAVVNDTTVTGTATKQDDTIIYHNDLEDDEGELPLPGEEDSDSSGTLSGGSTSTTGKPGVEKPMGIPSSGYTGKSALPQTGEDNNTLLMVIGMFMLVAVLGMSSLYYAKRKQ